MLGETGLEEAMVSQAAWIRSLTATYIRPWDVRTGGGIGGLFGAPLGREEGVLPWSRAQQAAFLITAGLKLRNAIASIQYPWTEALRKARVQEELLEEERDSAFYGPQTLLNTDQGVRGFLFATNHLCYVKARELDLWGWVTNEDAGAADKEAVSEALASLESHESSRFLEAIAHSLAEYDWRTSAAPGLTDEQKTLKAAFRGSGGYRELRMQLFRHLAQAEGAVGEAAAAVLERVQ
jgi:hypothetical protein